MALLGVLLVVLLGAAAARAPVAAAVPSLTVATPYPAVTAEAGESVTFDLTVKSPVPQRVDLSVDAPEGWQTTLRGGGYVVSSVYAGAGSPGNVTLEVAVPARAAGSTSLTVTADGAVSGYERLRLTVSVQGKVSGAVSLDTEFRQLSGTASDTFDYSVTLSNDTPEKTTFAISVKGPPRWSVSANPSTKPQATTVTVEGGGQASIDVSADPPKTVRAGKYQMLLQVSGGGHKAAIRLVATVKGNTAMELTTPSGQLNASGTAGSATEVVLLVRNTGSAPLTDVSFSASPPAEWQVRFEPETLAAIKPGQAQRVTAVITPADEAVTGDYMVTLTAQAGQQQASTDIRFTVETSRWWGLLGIVIIAAAVGGLWYAFRTYGRR